MPSSLLHLGSFSLGSFSLGSFHLGSFHLPVQGVCSAVGLMAALLLSQATAHRVRLNADKVWNAALAIALAALVFSRALLVAGSFRLFLQAPLLVLTLPTVNDTGLLLTSLFAAAYLRWQRLPWLGFLDAMAPCAALLWSFLSLGRLLEGTREGMPAVSGSAWPVELLSVTFAALLCAGLLWGMRRLQPAGRVFAAGLVAAGLAVFGLDFLRLPADLAGTGILDPVQWLGLAMIVAGVALVIAVPAISSKSRTGMLDAL